MVCPLEGNFTHLLDFAWVVSGCPLEGKLGGQVEN